MITSDAGREVDAALFKLAQRIREEFEEAPGLRITVIEASRFWGLDEETCGRARAALRDRLPQAGPGWTVSQGVAAKLGSTSDEEARLLARFDSGCLRLGCIAVVTKVT
jgi:hypothetical protein